MVAVVQLWCLKWSIAWRGGLVVGLWAGREELRIRQRLLRVVAVVKLWLAVRIALRSWQKSSRGVAALKWWLAAREVPRSQH